jgi:hypothetical protein
LTFQVAIRTSVTLWTRADFLDREPTTASLLVTCLDLGMRRVVVVMLVVAILLDAAYWTIWHTNREWIASEHTQAYYDFENAFPLADLWLGLACLLALVALVRRHPTALLWLVATGAAGLYLGSMDLMYDLEHDIFTRGGGGAVEAVIVALTWIFSITVLRFAWTRRGELLAGAGGVPEDSEPPPRAP